MKNFKITTFFFIGFFFKLGSIIASSVVFKVAWLFHRLF